MIYIYIYIIQCKIISYDILQSITSTLVAVEHVSRSLRLPFEAVQERNFYKVGQKTPFGDEIGSATFNWTLPKVWSKLRADADFDERLAEVARYNAGSRWRKRGLAMTPVKYGMSIGDYHSLSTVKIYGASSIYVYVYIYIYYIYSHMYIHYHYQ